MNTAFDAINSVRLQTKRSLISRHGLTEGDFCNRPSLSYLPYSSAIRKHVRLMPFFENPAIARHMQEMHKFDQSFHLMARELIEVLQRSGNSVPTIAAFACGSGQINQRILSVVGQQPAIIYGVDVCEEMLRSTQRLMMDALDQRPSSTQSVCVKADVREWDELSAQIPALRNGEPVISVSHGGARYFADGHEEKLIDCFARFPKGSEFIFGEVGDEFEPMMRRLLQAATDHDAIECDTTVHSLKHCNYLFFNASYFYLLLDAYYADPSFKASVESHVSLSLIADGGGHEPLAEAAITRFLMEVAGERLQNYLLLRFRAK